MIEIYSKKKPTQGSFYMTLFWLERQNNINVENHLVPSLLLNKSNWLIKGVIYGIEGSYYIHFGWREILLPTLILYMCSAATKESSWNFEPNYFFQRKC